MKQIILSIISLLLLAPGQASALDKVFDCIVAQDGTGDYATIQEAIDNAPEASPKPYAIFIKAGRYHEHLFIPVGKSNLSLIGQGREMVTIADDRVSGGPNACPVDVGATVVTHATDIYLEGITFENFWGTRHKDGPQALALYTKGDRTIVNRCAMLSYQDTYRTANELNWRNYVKDCWIEGAVDFIYGQGNVFFDHCTLNIVLKSGGWIVAPKHFEGTTWGYVLKDTRITAPGYPSETSVWLGRPWLHNPKAVFIDTKAEVTIPDEGWFDHMGTLPEVFADYNTTDAQGRPLNLSKRINRYFKVTEKGDTIYGTAKNRLTKDEVAQYTVQNVLSGNDHWDPESICRPLPRPIYKAHKGTLSWSPIANARGYVVVYKPSKKVIAITKDCSAAIKGKSTDYEVLTVGPVGNIAF